MEKIKWCMGLKKGLEMVDPNENLSKVYIEKSERALSAAASLKNNKDWEISSSYYAMYFALYAILMKIGVKCENHTCTIEFMNIFLLDYFDAKDVKQIRTSMALRVDAQYYADRQISEEKYRKIVDGAPRFLVKCREVLFKMKDEEIDNIRKMMKI